MSHEDINPLFKEENGHKSFEFLRKNKPYIRILKYNFNVKAGGQAPVIGCVEYLDYKSIYDNPEYADDIAWTFGFKGNKNEFGIPLTFHVLVLSPPNVCIHLEELVSSYTFDRRHQESLFDRLPDSMKPYYRITISAYDRPGRIPASSFYFTFAKGFYNQNSSFHFNPFKVTYHTDLFRRYNSYLRRNFTVNLPLKKYFFQKGSHRMPLFNNKTCFLKPPPRHSKEYKRYMNNDYLTFPYEIATLYVGERRKKISLSREVKESNGTKNIYRTTFYIVPIGKEFRLE